MQGLYRRKRSKFWWAAWSDDQGNHYRRSTKCVGEQEARQVLAQWRIETSSRINTALFDEVMLKYLQDKPNERHIYAVRRLRPHWTGFDLAGLNNAAIERYIKSRKKDVKPATINREIGLLSAAINHANSVYGMSLPNPIKRLKEPEGRLRWLTRKQARKLIKEASKSAQAPYLKHFIILALHTGCRSGELLNLEWDRVNIKQGYIMLESEHTKAGKRRYVPINVTALKSLKALANDSPYVFFHNKKKVGSVKRSFATACKRAKIEDFHIHDLRHTSAAWLVQSGIDLYIVRDILGHSTIKMTERYAHLSPVKLRDALAVLDGRKKSVK